MENIRKHLPFGSAGKQSTGESRSKFHLALPVSEAVQEYKQALQDYTHCVQRTSGAGSYLAQKLVPMLKHTPYAEIAGQFLDVNVILDTRVKERVAMTTAEIEAKLCQIAEETSGATSDGDSTEVAADKNSAQQQVSVTDI